MADTPARILVVEDEKHLAAGLKLNLELEGYAVETAGTAREASFHMVDPRGFAAVILDVMLPDLDGFDFCQRMREAGNHTPVIMLTARSAPDDRVRGLEVGADDYLPKPFDVNELLARVRSLLRRQRWAQRSEEQEDHDQLRFGGVVADFATHEVTVDGESIRLTRLELDLLRYFAANAGRVLSREELLQHVWNLSSHPNTRTVDNFIVRLRRQLEPDPQQPRHFVSVRGAGYKFVP